MITVSIFIASSSRDTQHERDVVGDAVRVLNDQYEPAGYRIRLNCWEDYAPEFTGERKQTEYNNDLIKKSHLFIALFRSVCGKFTQEEVRLWHSELGHKPTVFDIQDPTADKTAINTFLSTEGLTSVVVEDENEIRAQVRRLVTEYVNNHPTAYQTDSLARKKIYATIPDDRAQERASFGNLVRSVDDMARQYFHYYCHLTREDSSQITKSDYYAAILKDHVSSEEESEVLEAINGSVNHKTPSVVLYYNPTDLICTNHSAIANAVNTHGVFNEAYDSLYRVKYNLIKWLYQQSFLRVDIAAGIDIRDGWFYFCGLPVMPLALLGINGGTIIQQSAELIKQFSFAVLGVNTLANTSDSEVDIEVIDEQIAKAQGVLTASVSIAQGAKERLRQLLEYVSHQIDTILSNDVTINNINNLTGLIQRKEQIQLQLDIEPREIIRTQMLVVQVHDTYPEEFAMSGLDIDQQYHKVATTADKFGIIDPTVEMMRMNYANYLMRQNRNQKALTVYEEVMTHIDDWDDHSALYRNYIMHLYVAYINHLSFLGENERAQTTLKSLEAKEKRWESYSLSTQERISNTSRILASWLRIRPIAQDVSALLNAALGVYNEALAIPQDSIDYNIRDEVYCDLPICIISTSIDSYEYQKMPIAQLKAIIQYLVNNILEYTSCYPDEPVYLTYNGNAYHNLAFFTSNIEGDQLKAREYCKKALEVRRNLYALQKWPNNLYEVAETLLMLGATYVNNLKGRLNEVDYREAIVYADECQELYQSLNKEHYLAQDTRLYEAVQLKGSIEYYGGDKNVGLKLLREAWDWNTAHPGNSYETVFKGVAGRILKKERII